MKMNETQMQSRGSKVRGIFASRKNTKLLELYILRRNKGSQSIKKPNKLIIQPGTFSECFDRLVPAVGNKCHEEEVSFLPEHI